MYSFGSKNRTRPLAASATRSISSIAVNGGCCLRKSATRYRIADVSISAAEHIASRLIQRYMSASPTKVERDAHVRDKSVHGRQRRSQEPSTRFTALLH